MSEDQDFDMEVVGDDELDEMDADGASSSDERSKTEKRASASERESSNLGGSNREPKGSQSFEQATTDETAPAVNPEVEGWSRISLGDFASFQNGNAFSKSDWGEDGYPIIRIQNLTGEADEYNYYDGKLEERYRVNSGDTLLTWSGTIGVFKWEGPVAALNQHIFNVETSGEVNDSFFHFKLEELIPQLEALSHGSTMKHVRKADLVNIDVELPPLPEQRKIASVLYAVDQAIQKTEAIIGKLRHLRRNYIDEVCTSGYYQHDEKKRVRVGPRRVEIPTAWDFVTLESVTSLITKGQTPTSHGFEYLDRGINFVKAESIDEDGRLIEGEFANIGKEADEKLSRSRLECGDVLFSIAGALGKVAQVEEHHLPANINQALALIRCDDEKIDNRFIRYYLESKIIQKYIQSISTVTAQPNLSLKQVSEFNVLLPPPEEQNAIAQACKHFDKGIRSEEKQLRQLERLKKGLMQDLLTGKVRTADKAIEVLNEVKSHG